MMQIIKLNIGSSSHNGKKEESQPKEIAKGNLKIKYCYKRNQSRNNDYQPINYGNNFNDQRHFQQLQNQKQIKQYGKSQNFCSLNPEVGMIQSFNPLQDSLTTGIMSNSDLMRFPQGTIRSGKLFHKRLSVSKIHRKNNSVLNYQQKPKTARNLKNEDECYLQVEMSKFKTHRTNANQTDDNIHNFIDGTDIRNFPKNFDSLGTQKIKDLVKKQINKDSRSISQINPYTKKEYLYHQKRKEQRSLREIQQAKRVQKLKSIIKPCQISSLPLSNRSSRSNEKTELTRPNTQNFKRKVSLNCESVNRQRLTSFTNLGKFRKIRQDLNPWQTQLNHHDNDHFF